MNKHIFAALIAASLLSVTGTIYADSSVFPSASLEGDERSPESISANKSVPATASEMTGMNTAFPSAGIEGHEKYDYVFTVIAPRNLDRSYAGGQGDRNSVFPSAAIE